jgi:hypothetical protein
MENLLSKTAFSNGFKAAREALIRKEQEEHPEDCTCEHCMVPYVPDNNHNSTPRRPHGLECCCSQCDPNEEDAMTASKESE